AHLIADVLVPELVPHLVADVLVPHVFVADVLVAEPVVVARDLLAAHVLVAHVPVVAEAPASVAAVVAHGIPSLSFSLRCERALSVVAQIRWSAWPGARRGAPGYAACAACARRSSSSDRAPPPVGGTVTPETSRGGRCFLSRHHLPAPRPQVI